MPTDSPPGDPSAAGSAAAADAADAADVEVSGLLTEPQAAEVLNLAERAAREDGVGPLSEHVMLYLRYGGDRQARNFLLWRDGSLAGYGHLDPTDPVAAPSGEMIIDPAFRHRGLGLTLARALIAEAGDRGLRLWAHGDLPAATRLAAAAGFRRTRALWRMQRSLHGQLGAPELADGLQVRAFQAGQDEDAWTALNRKAFARHPEQGTWTSEDLNLREREPWFDPAGFFLAERDGRLVGFHWTKMHGATDHGATDHGASDHGHEPIGEVYVVGVDPDERGTGLGRALTLIGLRYLRDRGLAQVMLYVDEDNTPAIKLYESLGFTRRDTDAMFTHAPQ
ncbi:MAG TPA: mycothiol synthase [Streptosporangiaceae bacterium]|nr:mycothiol synthase [Streptosporangiaceae bacterium]